MSAPTVRWLPKAVTLPTYDWLLGVGGSMTYYPGWVDVAVYPDLAPFTLDEPPQHPAPYTPSASPSPARLRGDHHGNGA